MSLVIRFLFVIICMNLLTGCVFYNSFKVGNEFREDREKINLPKLNLEVDLSAVIKNEITEGSSISKEMMPIDHYVGLFSYRDELNFFDRNAWGGYSHVKKHEMGSRLFIPWKYYPDGYFECKKSVFTTPLWWTTRTETRNYEIISGSYQIKISHWYNFTLVKDSAMSSKETNYTAVLNYDKDLTPSSTISLNEKVRPFVSFTYPWDPRISDLSDIFAWEMKHNIIQSTSVDQDSGGTAVLSIKKITQKKSLPLSLMLGTVNTLTLGIGSVYGIPSGHQRAKVLLQLDIKDKTGKIIKSYTASGSSLSCNSLYYGMQNVSSRRKNHARAVHKALNKIKKQLKIDSKDINSLLKQ